MPRRSRLTDRASSCGQHEPGPVRVLAVADVPDEGLLASVSAVATAELILACGDLPFDYLGYLINALDIPLVFGPGHLSPAGQASPDGHVTSKGALLGRTVVRNVAGRHLLDIGPASPGPPGGDGDAR